MTDPDPAGLVRPHIRSLEPYVPGEQPQGGGWTKLNTNESPFGPSPGVKEALRRAVGDDLRRYPSPDAGPLRRRLAERHRCDPASVIVGNGSDELLALASRAFAAPPEGTIQYFVPSYSLYPVLAAIQDLRTRAVPLEPGFGIPGPGAWSEDAQLSLITTPNAPGGRYYPAEELAALCRRTRGVVVLDEAYADFAPGNAMRLALEEPNVLVARTFSKGWSLCALRIGYMVGHPALVGALHRIRDSYNVNGLAQRAALAALEDRDWYRERQAEVVRERRALALALGELGFEALPSAANFLLAAPPGAPAAQWLQRLRERRILVRWFDRAPVSGSLRITVGSPEENRRLLRAAEAVSRELGEGRE